MMIILVLLIAGGVVATVAVVLSSKSKNGLARSLVRARATGEVGGLVAAIEASPAASRATLWDQAIGALWADYAREAATHLIMAGAQRSDADILQYWIQRVMEVEPEIAHEFFSDDFLTVYFRPQVAAGCGKCGCS